MHEADRLFLRACRGQPVERVPIWMMRQAGRYQPEYRAIKERAGGFLELCRSPDDVAEVTVFAQRSLGADAAIIFSDITLPACGMGQDLTFNPGPVLSPAIRTRDDVDRLRPLRAADFDFLAEAIRRTRRGLADTVSLIGFVGAPLTLAGYMIEGTPSRGWTELKRMAYGDPETLEALLETVVDAVLRHARLQIEAGCDALQLFDSTAGQLAAAELHRFAFATSARVIEGLRDTGVPLIYFARDIGAHLETAAGLGAHVLGLDWTVSIASARSRLGDDVCLMGNLDPAVLLCAPEVIEARAEAILRESRGLRGFIFNLGHGIVPETPPQHARHLVEVVQRWRG